MLRRSDFAALPLVRIESVRDPEQYVEHVDYPEIGLRYAEGVASGELMVCRQVRRAAERFLKMRELAEHPSNYYGWSDLHVIDYCSFVEKFRHFESGRWEFNQVGADGEVDDRILLEPFKIWIENAVHGFRLKTTGERLVTTALEMLPRKNSKSTSMAPGALFEICCSGSRGAQVPIAAASQRQADDTIFAMIQKLVDNEPDLAAEYGVEKTAREITCKDSRIWALTGQGEKQDGLNPSLAIFEEGHGGAQSVWNVIDSAFGARPNALRRMITTAGYHPEGPGYSLQKDVERILAGSYVDDSLFGAIYTLDPEDYQHPQSKAIEYDRLFGSEKLLAKANPMYGISLDPRVILQKGEEARRSPIMRAEFVRTRYNLWVGAGHALVKPEQWELCRRDIRMDHFIGLPCTMGVDLATYHDLCAISIQFELPGDIIAWFCQFFLPEQSDTALDPEMFAQYRSWAEDENGWLVLTPGTSADHDRVRSTVVALSEILNPSCIACDPAQAHNTVKNLHDGSLPVMTYPNNQFTMTGPTDDILSRITTQKLIHDGNPVLAWNVANVHGERRGNGLILPRKEKDGSFRKIDGFVSGCFARGVAMSPEQMKTPGGKRVWKSAYSGPDRHEEAEAGAQ